MNFTLFNLHILDSWCGFLCTESWVIKSSFRCSKFLNFVEKGKIFDWMRFRLGRPSFSLFSVSGWDSGFGLRDPQIGRSSPQKNCREVKISISVCFAEDVPCIQFLGLGFPFWFQSHDLFLPGTKQKSTKVHYLSFAFANILIFSLERMESFMARKSCVPMSPPALETTKARIAWSPCDLYILAFGILLAIVTANMARMFYDFTRNKHLYDPVTKCDTMSKMCAFRFGTRGSRALSPKIFKIIQSQAILRENPYFEQILGSGSLWGQNSAGLLLTKS